MNSWLALLFASVALLAPTPVQAVPSEDPKGYCASKWDTYRMQLHCVEQEEQARRRLYSKSHVEQRIWFHCSDRWDNWRMMEYCVQQEETAKEQLQRR